MNKSIVIAGAGFASLTTIQTLRREGCNAPITLVAPRPVFFYYPSLIWVPAGLRTEQDLTCPLDGFIRRHNVQFVTGTVTGLNPSTQCLKTTAGDLDYERLVITTGGRYIKRLPGIEHTFIPCEGYATTAALKERLNTLSEGTLAFGFSSNPNEPAAIRGGPLFEFLFGIDTLLRRQKRRTKFDLIFFTPATEPGKRLGPKALTRLTQEMEKRGIRMQIGQKLTGFKADRVMTEGGDIKSDLTVFIPGMTGPAWAEKSGLPLSPGGFIQGDSQCRVPGFEGRIYVAGDSGSFQGPPWMPKQAHLADLQAKALARNLIGDMHGEKRMNTFRVELMCIIDTLDKGILVFRTPAFNQTLKCYSMHWAKRLFEGLYLHQYRS